MSEPKSADPKSAEEILKEATTISVPLTAKARACLDALVVIHDQCRLEHDRRVAELKRQEQQLQLHPYEILTGPRIAIPPDSNPFPEASREELAALALEKGLAAQLQHALAYSTPHPMALLGTR